MTIHIRPETPADRSAVWNVNQLAFGQNAEADLVNALRDGGYARLSLVAEVEGTLVAHVLFSEMAIVGESETTAALALAPMAVLPAFQSQGIGSKLIRRALELCAEVGHRIVIVLGHVHYYPRFGFAPELARALDSPFPRDSFMALELVPGAMQGVTGKVQYAPPFGIS